MAVNAFLTFFDQASGESIQRGHQHWVELTGWDWEVEAVTIHDIAGGGGVAKPTAGTLSCSHVFDRSSIVALGFIASGSTFAKAQLDAVRTTGRGMPETFLSVVLERVRLTKVSLAGTEDGTVSQRLELSFETVAIDYRAQDQKTGALTPPETFSWDIPAGTASPSA